MSNTDEAGKNWMNLGQAARYVGPSANSQMIWRACRKGTKGRNGERVYLQTRRIGAKLVTTKRWIDEYLDALNRADLNYFGGVGSKPAPAVRDAQFKATLDRLSSAGFNVK